MEDSAWLSALEFPKMVDEPINIVAELFRYPISNGTDFIDQGIAGREKWRNI